MVRTKGNPEKSLYEVDYTHPSVILWFFGGQVPTKHGSKSHFGSVSVSTTSIKDKVDKKASKVGVVKQSDDSELKLQLYNEKSIVHPLSQFTEVPALTDLQIFITEAIQSEQGNSCSFEKIFEYVSQRWKNIRRRDGSNYTTDCRRAIQANLRHNPNHVALFRKDKSKEGYWTLCSTMEESIEASKDRSSERIRNRKDRDGNNDFGEDSDIDDEDDDAQVSNANGKDTFSPPSVPPSHLSNEPNSPPQSTTSPTTEPSKETNSEFTNEISRTDQPKLTELQALVCECINDNSGSCHFDLIVHHVSKHWNSIVHKLGNTDVKSAILATLTDSKRLFKRDTKRTGWWMINSDIISEIGSPKQKRDEDSPTTPKSKAKIRARNMKETQENSVSSPDSSETINSPIDNIENISGDESQKQNKNDPPMTELQVLIIQAIDAEGGVASFDQIYERVSKKFDTIKRRDGTPYTSECRRAIQASLSNNPSTRPFFKKENKKGTVVWSLAKRSIEFLSEKKPDNLNDGEIAFKPDLVEQAEQKEDEIVDNNNDSDEIDEEIHDEEEYDEELEKEDTKTDDKQKKQREEPKEEKHLYANRVKRARKIKENAGKRYLNNDNGDFSHNEFNFVKEDAKPDTKVKKRRR